MDDGRDFKRRRTSYDRDERSPRLDRAGGKGGRRAYTPFHQFTRDGTPPEEAEKLYEQYLDSEEKKLAKEVFDAHKSEEWFQRRYDPVQKQKYMAQIANETIEQAKKFDSQLSAGKLKINYGPNQDDDAVAGDSKLETPEQNPEFDDLKYISSRTLFMPNLPTNKTNSEILEAVTFESAKPLAVLLSDPSRKEKLQRCGWAIYESSDDANRAMSAFKGQDEAKHTIVKRLQPNKSFDDERLPSEMSAPARIAFDLKQALQLADVLDKEAAVEVGITAMLQADTVSLTDEQKLDLVAEYLRQVHLFVYYKAIRCMDRADLFDCHPRTLRRVRCETAEQAAPSEEDGADQDPQWCAFAIRIDKNIEEYIQQVQTSSSGLHLVTGQLLARPKQDPRKKPPSKKLCRVQRRVKPRCAHALCLTWCGTHL
jgi:hypothetical protein